jgi:hypothetical protein
MHRRPALRAAAAAALAAAPRVASAQAAAVSAECRADNFPERVAEDACQKSQDVFNLLAPQLAATLAGGNVVLGQSSTTGGPGHFSLGLRVNAVRGAVPEAGNVRLSTGGARRTAIGVDDRLVGYPVADAAVGVFGGVPLGVTRALGVDLLLNATYVPDYESDAVSIRTTGGALRVGYGARVGLLQETALVPGVSLAVTRREVPATSIRVAVGDDDALGVSAARVRTDSWRLVAGKRLVFVEVAAGVGQDRYRSRADVEAIVRNETVVVAGVPLRIDAQVPVARLSQAVTRTNYFANLTLLSLPLVKVVGEIGRTTGGTLGPTFNDLGGRRPDAAYTYGSVGVRVGR